MTFLYPRLCIHLCEEPEKISGALASLGLAIRKSIGEATDLPSLCHDNRPGLFSKRYNPGDDQLLKYEVERHGPRCVILGASSKNGSSPSRVTIMFTEHSITDAYSYEGVAEQRRRT